MSESTITRTSRVAILTKEGRYGVISLDTGLRGIDGVVRHIVGTNDPRYKQPVFYNTFEDAAKAFDAFNEALALSRDRGWTVAHVCRRHDGQ